MTYERFLKITLGLQVESDRNNNLYKLGVDLINFIDPYHKMINELMCEVYGEDGYDWWSWFCWEADFGRKDWSTVSRYTKDETGDLNLEYESQRIWGARDADGNPICYSYKSTWEYLETNYRKK